jgi:hypothetical protein
MEHKDKLTNDDCMAYRKNIATTDIKFLNLCQLRDACGPEITATLCAAHEEATFRAIFACDLNQSLKEFIETFRDMTPTDAELEMAYNFHRQFRQSPNQGSGATTQ